MLHQSPCKQEYCLHKLGRPGCIFSILMATYTGGIGYLDERFIEYDLDPEDENWLEAFNRGQQRLPVRRFELLLWRLEVANADATDAALAAAGECC